MAESEHSSHYFSSQSPLASYGEPRSLVWEGQQIHFVTGAGVFAKSGLDTGSRIMLQAALPHLVELPDSANISDLGCGWGAVGCILGKELPQHKIWMSDINHRAIALALHNARLNKLTNLHGWCSDGLSAIPESFFHAVLCNPPIRAGNATIGKLFDDAVRTLQNGGALYAVIRTAQGAKSWQKRVKVLFGNCETISIKSGYRVFLARK